MKKSSIFLFFCLLIQPIFAEEPKRSLREEEIYQAMARMHGIEEARRPSAPPLTDEERIQKNRERAESVRAGDEPSDAYKAKVQALKEKLDCWDAGDWCLGTYLSAKEQIEEIIKSHEFRWSHKSARGLIKRMLDLCRPGKVECDSFIQIVLDNLTQEAANRGILEGLIGALDDPTLDEVTKGRILSSINSHPGIGRVFVYYTGSYYNYGGRAYAYVDRSVKDNFVLQINPQTRSSFFEPIYNALKGKNTFISEHAEQALARIGLLDKP